jgi:hypothetical protein
MRTATLAAALLLAAATAVAQDDPGPAPTAADLLARFGKLDPERRTTVARAIERRLQRSNDAVLQRIVSRERGSGAYPLRQPATWYDTAELAPVATPRQAVQPGAALHTASTRGMVAFEFLPDLHTHVVYDWGLGKAVRGPHELSDDQRFANCVHGYPPGTDHAVAQVLEAMDTDPAQRRLGSYFEHLYADRNGKVFVGVTLFAAWSSGRQIEMPDTDAIAFARHVLDTRSFTAPIPDDRRRERLYQQIRDAFASHREYRTLCCAAAAAFVAGTPRLDETYQPLVKRCHWLWVQCDYDPKVFAERLRKAADRSQFLREIDASIRGTMDTIDATVRDLQDLADWQRRQAARELDAVGG